MQYWVLNPTAACPVGWDSATDAGVLQCVQTTMATTVTPAVASADLPTVTLTGTAAQGGLDTAQLAVGTAMYTVSNTDSVLNLAGNWLEAEFNIFGSSCGSQATFASGSTVSVQTSVDDGSTNTPTCDLTTFTGETNNLNLQPGALALGGVSPAISFSESGVLNGTPACATAGSHGETHLTTFNGLLYDFQASGDFTLIKTASDFTVQARQVSAKPSWPNASLNTAVATQMGKDSVAVCLNPTRLMINGKSADLGEGKSLLLPSGVYIQQKDNMYLVARENGDSVAATVHNNFFNSWIDVSIGLGRWPSRVSGLLASRLENIRELETQNRTVVKVPVSFDYLYHQYANSWRVPQGESLLCDGDVEIGIPQRPFYAEDLDREQYSHARETCIAAGVKDASLLDACTLDVTVLRDKTAANVFQNARPPRAVMPRPSPARGHEP